MDYCEKKIFGSDSIPPWCGLVCTPDHMHGKYADVYYGRIPKTIDANMYMGSGYDDKVKESLCAPKATGANRVIAYPTPS